MKTYPKITIRVGGSTAAYTDNTVDTVYTVYTVYTIQSALRGEARSAPKLFPLFLKSWTEAWTIL